MNVNFEYHDVSASDRLEILAGQKLLKLEQKYDFIVSADVYFKKENKSGFILPKKKPLIAGTKKVKDIKISKYYNKKDFNLAKKAISEMKKARWTDALRTSKKAKGIK